MIIKKGLITLKILLISFFCFSQTKIKEKREISYTMFRDKDGIEKKRKQNFINNITKYDTLGNKIEFIRFGEVSERYSENSVSSSWNYQNIKYSTKYTFIDTKLIADTTFYYKDNKVNYLYSTTKYIYDNLTGNLLRAEEYNNKNEIQKIVESTYNDSSLLIQKIEITYGRYSASTKKADTTTINLSYDIKKRLIKEASKTKNFSWSREYEFDEKLKIKRKYYFDNTSKFPNSIDFMNLDDNGNPIKIESVGFGFGNIVYTTTEITYDKNGLLKTEIEIPNYSRCDYNEPIHLIVYEYDYYK
jgi:hypothetical protein